LKSTLVITTVGIFALNSKEKIIERKFFSKDPKKAANKYSKLLKGEIISELSQLLKELKKKKYNELFIEDRVLASKISNIKDFNCTEYKESNTIQKFREKLDTTTVKLGRFKDLKDFQDYTRKITLTIAEQAITSETQKKDLHAIQAIRTLDDLDKTLNLFSGRVREWYGLHFPELEKLVDKHETYARLVSNLGDRGSYNIEKLESEGIPEQKAKVISEKADSSIGYSANPSDLETLQNLSKNTVQLFKLRNTTEEFLEKIMKKIAPNLTAILGPLMSARLISIAGSLERLAMMPSSTIQVLGAEKALFRSLKTGSRPPKHGIIFQHQAIHTAPKWQRGKIARAISSKLSIAARIDAFGGDFIGDQLSAYIDRRVLEIQKKYPFAPQVKKRHGRGRGSRT
jgi:nucleolar protein 56